MTHECFFALFREVHALFHKHWSDAVGQPGYDKGHWRQLDNALVGAFRNQATAIGIAKDEPLLRREKDCSR